MLNLHHPYFLMGVFRGEYQLDEAIDAALAIKAQIAAMEPIKAADLIFKPEISIGVNSGEMVCGNIDSASLRRLDYTVIGDEVNLAQRFNLQLNLDKSSYPKKFIRKQKNHSVSKKLVR